MIIHLVVAKDNEQTFNSHLVPSAKRFNVNCFQVGDKPDANGNIVKKSIGEKYNIMIGMLNQQNIINDDTIVVFVHEDINILDNLFIEKLNTLFTEKPEIGMMGVVGVEQIQEGGWWLDEENKPVGHMVKGVDGENITKGEHATFGGVGYYDNIAAVDGSLIAIRASLLKDITFDTDTLKSDRNMYAMDIGMQILQKGYRLCVADILVYHASRRLDHITDDWKVSKKLFDEKYKEQLPVTIESILKLSEREEILEVEI
tara:strand:+ start:9300 stop:10073 length:774 start_codon:yes stop_codon:yes gene_type:complete